jgi:flagellar motility protein MotE (MotC chaperone)
MGKNNGETPMPRDTEIAYSLREKLGSESAGKWLEFMDFIESSLPFILRGAGRPTTEEIASSAIGYGGFTSWREMIESSSAWGGLGWSYDTYKAWKKAYSLVQQHPYLRNLALSSSEINTVRRENKEFPASLEAFEALKNSRKDAQEERRQNSVAALQKQLFIAKKEVTEAQNGLAISHASEAQSKSVLSQIRQDLAQANEKIGSLQVQLEREKTTSENRKNKIQQLDKSLEGMASIEIAHKILNKYLKRLLSMSRWDLFIAFFKAKLPEMVTENKKS